MVHLIYLDHERKPAKGKHPSSSAYKYNEIELVLATNIESLKGFYTIIEIVYRLGLQKTPGALSRLEFFF